MTLAKNIRYLRKKNGWSQDFLAEKLGYKSYTTIQKWEMGTSEPPLKVLKALADLFDVDMNDFANEDLENPLHNSKDGKSVYYLDPDAAELAQEIYEDESKRMLFSATRDISKEDMQFVIDMVERLKRNADG